MTNKTPFLVFDRALVRRHWLRAKAHIDQHSALYDDVAQQLDDRLGEILHPFQKALDLSPFPFLSKRKENRFEVVSPDPFPDEEALPYAPESFDLIVSNLSLHWVNDLPDALSRIHDILRPGGLFLAAMIGEQSLYELRSCLADAEVAVTGGASPRLSPMIHLPMMSDLMQRAGYKLPVTDIETITLLYDDMFSLMRDLRGMGQTNAHLERLRFPTRRAVFLKAAELYQKRFCNADGLVCATIDVLFLHGRKAEK